MIKPLSFILLCVITPPAIAQVNDQPSLDSLKQEILELRTDVKAIQINLALSKKKLQRGIVVATVGYSLTIAGGLMLGRSQDDLGKALLVTGGATGLVGTFMLVDAFRYISPKKSKSK